MAPTKRKLHTEYRLLLEHTYDETLKKEGVLFLLETTMQFTNFSYQIDVKEMMEGTTIHWSLHGLRAPSMNMPETGTAQFSKVYFDLPKSITFILHKKEKVQASTGIKILKSSITVSDPHPNFLKIYTHRQEFENNRMNDTEPPEYKPDLHRTTVDHHTTPQKKKNE
ncbi:MAG: hypothetical protein AB1728_08060 [Bacteroidota bacterium]